MGRIVSIQLCPGHRAQMHVVPAATLMTDIGLQGDSHAKAGSKRQVLLADKEALDALSLEPGVIKENITVENIDVMSLKPGTHLRVGASAVLEVTSVCDPCWRMDEIRPGLQLELNGRRGMNSRVIAGGPIAVGDPVVIAHPTDFQPSVIP